MYNLLLVSEIFKNRLLQNGKKMLQRLKQNIKDQNNKIILKGHIKKIKLQVPKPLK